MPTNSADMLKSYWERFVLKREPVPPHFDGVRPEILASWQRSLSYSISPFEAKPPTLTEEQLGAILRVNRELIAVAHPYIENLYSYVKGTDFAIVLTDREGCIIDLISDDILINNLRERSGLRLGAIRNEQHAGTTSIGLCLQLNSPCMVYGAEHFLLPHHIFRCCAAPINNGDGQIIGCLSMIGPKEIPGNHTLGMVGAAADAIRKELQMRKSYQKIEYINFQLRTMLESLSTGILMVDSRFIVTQHNTLAEKILQLRGLNPQGMSLSDLIHTDKIEFDLYHLRDQINHQELRVTNPHGVSIELSLSAKLIYNNSSEIIGAIFSLDKLHNVHKLVTRLGGFTARYTFDSIIGHSPELLHAKKLGMVAAESQSNLLILGESGTGKELFAQSVHNASDRAGGPFVAINCASLPKSLIESELFGYERGAFTGANREGSPGKFELADSGTIFLDEIGDMSMELQASLLRVLQTREIVRIGGKQPKKVNVRIIAATNVNLLRSVQENRFRQDLYYRLNVLTIHLRPLRECRSDIIPLVHYFTERYGSALNKHCTFSAEALAILEQYDWPGNVRELENVIERTVNLAQDSIITERELPPELLAQAPPSFGTEDPDSTDLTRLPESIPLCSPVREYERIVKALRQEHGNIPSASILLGMPKRTLYRKIKKYNIDLQRYRIW